MINIDDIDFNYIPIATVSGAMKRIADWIAAGGKAEDPYIQRQLEYLKDIENAVRAEERKRGEMSKKDYIIGRMDGLKLALRIADRDGIDGIRKEIAYRNNGGINTRLSMRELDEASQTIKENCVDTILIMSMYALRDEYGYGKNRMQRFYDRFMLKTDMVLNHVTDFPEIRKTLEKELGYEINKRIGITGVELFRKKLGIKVEDCL